MARSSWAPFPKSRLYRTWRCPMSFRKEVFRASDLRKIGSYAPDHPPVRIGEYVELNSGSPPLLVVDADDTHIAVSWRDDDGKAEEEPLPRACFHRVPFTP